MTIEEHGIPECYLGLIETLKLPPPPPPPPQQGGRNDSNGTLGGNGMTDDLNNSYYAYGIGPFLFLFIVLWNGLLIYSLLSNRQKRKRISITKRLFIYHSCTDLITGLVVVPIQITAHFQHGYTCWYLSLAVMFTVFSQCTGVSTLLTVSWLRYLSITKPLLIVKATWVLLTIGLEFILTLTISLYTFFVYLRKSTAHMIAANFLVLVIYLSLSSIILIGFNLKSFTSLGQQQRRMSMYDDNTRNSKRNNRAVLTLALITSCYLICTVPYIIYSCMLGSYLYSENAELLKYFRYLESFIYVQALYLLNCGLTAMIYVCRNKRHFLKRRVTTRSRIGQQKLSVGLKQRRHQNESSETISSSTSAV